jgi:hypothetical protein
LSSSQFALLAEASYICIYAYCLIVESNTWLERLIIFLSSVSFAVGSKLVKLCIWYFIPCGTFCKKKERKRQRGAKKRKEENKRAAPKKRKKEKERKVKKNSKELASFVSSVLVLSYIITCLN